MLCSHCLQSGGTDGMSQRKSQLNTIVCRFQAVHHSLIMTCWHCWSYMAAGVWEFRRRAAVLFRHHSGRPPSQPCLSQSPCSRPWGCRQWKDGSVLHRFWLLPTPWETQLSLGLFFLAIGAFVYLLSLSSLQTFLYFIRLPMPLAHPALKNRKLTMYVLT